MQELVTGSKTADAGVRNAMLRALYEVVRKAGGSMSEVSISSIIGIINNDSGNADGWHSTQPWLCNLIFFRRDENHERETFRCFDEKLAINSRYCGTDQVCNLHLPHSSAIADLELLDNKCFCHKPVTLRY